MRRISAVRCLLFVFALLACSLPLVAQVRISVRFGPPPIPVYEQPICPGEGYIWTPGYWAWDGDFDDYYWVPGTWVLAPEPGFLWTPPYWGWDGGVYIFHEGYWGPHVGFYGGINYGFGYFGVGFVGGRWEGDRFFYNRDVVHVENVRNVYEERVNVTTVNRVSYNGGPGGIDARPRPEDEVAARDRHVPPVAAQTQHFEQARSNPKLRATANRGKPPVAATARAAEFRGGVPAREAGGAYNPPADRGRAPAGGGDGGARPAVHPNDLPPFQRPTAPAAEQSNQDRKYQQQQDKMFAKQQQERQKLQEQQDREHQQMEHQNANGVQRQQMEQRHQQQTEQLQERHTQEQQHMQEKHAPNKR